MSERSKKHNSGWNPNVGFQVAAAFSFSVRDGDGGVEVQQELSIQVGAGAGRPRSRPSRGPRDLHILEMVVVDTVQHPPRGRHRRDRPVKILTVGEHRDPGDRIRAVSDRDREIGEDPPWWMEPSATVGGGQRRRDRVDQTGVLGHLSQQPDPRMRHPRRRRPR